MLFFSWRREWRTKLGIRKLNDLPELCFSHSEGSVEEDGCRREPVRRNPHPSILRELKHVLQTRDSVPVRD